MTCIAAIRNLQEKYLMQDLDQQVVTVQRTQKLADAGKPLITFNAKAQTLLISTPEKDKAVHVKKVKLAEEDLVEVTNIRTNGQGNKAVVDYTTAFKNVTPFVKLTTDDFTVKKTNKARFALVDEGWKLEKNLI
jgi:hypothetical protein